MSTSYGCWEHLSKLEKRLCFDETSKPFRQLTVAGRVVGAWKVKGKLQEEWNRLLREIQSRTDNDDFREIVSPGIPLTAVIRWNLYLVGNKAAVKVLKPTIVAECKDVKIAEQACKALSEQRKYSLQLLLATYEIRYAQVTLRLRSDETPDINSSFPAFSDEATRSLCGRQIVIVSEKVGREQSCTSATIGGVLLVDGTPYAMTAAHAFQLDDTITSENQSSTPDLENENEGESVLSNTTANSPDSTPTDDVLQVRRKVYAQNCPADFIDADSLRLKELPALSRAALVNEADNVVLLNQQEDWALIPVNNPRFTRTNKLKIEGHSSIEVIGVAETMPQGRIVLGTGISDPATSAFTTTESLFLLPNSDKLQIMWSAVADSNPGDCGAWTIDEESKASAMVIAASEEDREIFCLPLAPIINSIRHHLDAHANPTMDVESGHLSPTSKTSLSQEIHNGGKSVFGNPLVLTEGEQQGQQAEEYVIAERSSTSALLSDSTVQKSRTSETTSGKQLGFSFDVVNDVKENEDRGREKVSNNHSGVDKIEEEPAIQPQQEKEEAWGGWGNVKKLSKPEKDAWEDAWAFGSSKEKKKDLIGEFESKPADDEGGDDWIWGSAWKKTKKKKKKTRPRSVYVDTFTQMGPGQILLGSKERLLEKPSTTIDNASHELTKTRHKPNESYKSSLNEPNAMPPDTRKIPQQAESAEEQEAYALGIEPGELSGKERQKMNEERNDDFKYYASAPVLVTSGLADVNDSSQNFAKDLKEKSKKRETNSRRRPSHYYLASSMTSASHSTEEVTGDVSDRSLSDKSNKARWQTEGRTGNLQVSPSIGDITKNHDGVVKSYQAKTSSKPRRSLSRHRYAPRLADTAHKEEDETDWEEVLRQNRSRASNTADHGRAQKKAEVESGEVDVDYEFQMFKEWKREQNLRRHDAQMKAEAATVDLAAFQQREWDNMQRERDQMQRERDHMQRERDHTQRERDAMNRERDVLQRERDLLKWERDAKPEIDEQTIITRFEALLLAERTEREEERRRAIQSAEERAAAMAQAEKERREEEKRIRAEATRAAEERAAAMARAEGQRREEEKRIRAQAVNDYIEEEASRSRKLQAERAEMEKRIRSEAVRAAEQEATSLPASAPQAEQFRGDPYTPGQNPYAPRQDRDVADLVIP